ncbi:hypothetical protein U0070_024388 [Myodes glareolus]|uniref:G-protein coupled receptors family 1 profile domain-containing protein n=1 Tax=Myodes glareolus TaxID=447135 RepID=A0AAW0H3S9_MYOGA
MEMEKCSLLPDFFLLGISSNPDMKGVLFLVFLVFYLIILLSNVGLIVLIRIDSQLHTPMYFYLNHLAFSNLSYSTAVGPNVLLENNPISFVACFLQFLLVCIFIDIECMFLAVMAFDRYKAISNPLVYAVDMSTYVSVARHILISSSVIFPAVLLLSCSDIQVNELVLFIRFGFIELNTISGVHISYCYIISSVLKINSARVCMCTWCMPKNVNIFCIMYPKEIKPLETIILMNFFNYLDHA